MDIFIGVVFIATLIFPLPYIFYKKGQNKLIFISAVIGSTTIIELLVIVACLPIIILSIFVMPALEHNGFTENISFLLVLSGYIENYYWFLTPIIHIAIALAIHKRYAFFHANT